MDNKIRCKIKKVFNNNVILVIREDDKEEVLLGKGIGFSKKKNQLIELESSRIEKSFITCDQKFKKEYFNLIDKLDGKIVGLCEEIISMAEEELGTLNQHIHIALTDHISFAIERISSGMVIDNPFLGEIKVLYNQEYRLAIKAIALIEKRLKISLSEAETGFITMHFHTARENSDIENTLKNISLISDLVTMIETGLGISLEAGELNYIRLINHLHLGIERVTKNIKIQNPLIPTIKSEFQESYKLAGKLIQLIEDRLNVQGNESERGYMAIHIQRLRETLNNTFS